MRAFLSLLAFLLVTLGTLAGLFRVTELEAEELEHVSPWTHLLPTRNEDGALEPKRRLATVSLEKGEEATFEVCVHDEMDPRAWKDAFELAVWVPETHELLVRTPLDERRLGTVRRRAGHACVVVAEGRGLPMSARVALEAVWPDHPLPEAIREVPIRARIVARRPLTRSDGWPVLCVFFGATLALLTFLLPFHAPQHDAPDTRAAAAKRITYAIVGLLGVALALGLIPFWGAAAGLLRAFVLACAETAAALALTALVYPRVAHGAADELQPRTRWVWLKRTPPGSAFREALGLRPPKKRFWLLIAAPFIGVALSVAGSLLVRRMPSSGDAPIELLVSWPSGMLAVAVVAVLAPIAEELFFRGFVYGTLERTFGTPAAFIVTVVLFVGAHVPQTWGAFGALLSLLLTGVLLTWMRQLTGSTVAPAVAHLAHNATIAIVAIT